MEEQSKIYFYGNRFKKPFEKAISKVNFPDIYSDGYLIFSYWDTYFGDPIKFNSLEKNVRVLQLIKRSAVNPLSNKSALPKMLAKAKKSHVAPPTYNSISQAKAHKGEEISVWFFKSAHGTGGKNMFCVSTDDISKAELPQHYVIQAGVQNLALIDGKKFTTRIYVLIWNGATYLYNNGFLVIHGTTYDETSTDYAVQINHVGYDDPNSPIKMQQLVHYDDYEKFVPKFTELIREIDPIFAEAKAASDQNSYILLGIDVLLQASGDIKLIEINTFPNFLHTQEITEQVNIPFFTAAIETMLGYSVEPLKKIT